MADSYVSFSNPNSLDIFPSFKSFHEPKNDQGAFTIDERDITEITNQSKQNNPTPVTPKKSSSNLSIQCDLCSVPISSEIVYITHINGRKHQAILASLLSKNPQYKTLTYAELCSKKQEPVNVNNQNETSEPSSSNLPVNDTNKIPPLILPKQLLCNICNVPCNSQQMFDKHITGKKHQMKLKLTTLNTPAPLRNIPDNNPSSSNYCDVCSLQLKSENELTEHLTQNRHQTKVKEAEICMKAANEMKINFDDYKILTTTAEKNTFNYECTKCNKKMNDKIQLIEHLKSISHTKLVNQTNKEVVPKVAKREKHSATRGGLATRGRSLSSSRGSNKPAGNSRSYQSHRSSWNQQSQPFHEQTSDNPFGAFDPYNQSTYSSDQNYYPSTKRSAQYDEIPSEYDGFYPKRSRTYNDGADNSGDFYSTNNNYYLPNNDPYSVPTTNYADQSQQPSWPYQTDPYYDQQQYSNPEPNYTNPMYYPPNPPPLPSYEPPPPPLPTYPPPSSAPYYSQDSTYPPVSEDLTSNQYYSSSFPY